MVHGLFSLQWLPGLQSRGLRPWASAVAAPGLRSTGSVVVPHGRWDLPGSGIEPVSPALAGGSFTTGPSEKASILTLKSRRQGTSLAAQWLRL